MRLPRHLQWTGLGLLLLVVVGVVAGILGSARGQTRTLDQALTPNPAVVKLMRGFGGNPEDAMARDSWRTAVFRDAGIPGLRRLLAEMRLPESRWARRRVQWLLWAESKMGRKLVPLLSTRMPETRAAFAVGIFGNWRRESPSLPQGALPLLEEELSIAPWPQKPDHFQSLSRQDPDRIRGERIKSLIEALGNCGELGARALVTILNSHPHANARWDVLSAMGEVLGRAVRSRQRELAQAGILEPAIRKCLTSEDSGLHAKARDLLQGFEWFEKVDLESLPPPRGSYPGPLRAPSR